VALLLALPWCLISMQDNAFYLCYQMRAIEEMRMVYQEALQKTWVAQRA
jgi:hypothetical protein